MVTHAEVPGQLQLELNILPRMQDIFNCSDEKKRARNRRLYQLTTKQLKASIRRIRDDSAHDATLKRRLREMSKGYNTWHKTRLIRTTILMEWQVENYQTTGAVTIA